MSKQRSEKSHFDMANRIYGQMKDQQMELYRLFRVYHPVYEISVNIETELIEENYHIIEKYMDKLVCGYVGDNKTLGEGIYVKNKYELFELLGIDRQAYEIAEKFYQDLIAAGHFEEVPGIGIRGLKAAQESVKLEKRVNSAMVKQRKLFDQFSAKLMPGQFYEFQKYACKRETLNEDSPLLKNSVWLEPNVTILNSDADIEQMLGNFNYVSNERIERGLPQGYQSMSIAKNEPIEMSFYPYYLAIFLRGDTLEYKAFRVDNGQPIEWIGEQYKTAYYRAAVELFGTLAQTSEKNVENPLNRNFHITLDGAPDVNSGVSKMQNTGNYEWNLQNWQVKDLLGLSHDKKFKRSICLMIANNEIICLTSYEAGKIVKIKKTHEQKRILLAAVSLNDEERNDLFQTYLNNIDDTSASLSEKTVTVNRDPSSQMEGHKKKPEASEIREEKLMESSENGNIIPKKLTDEDRKRIKEAKRLYDQKRYTEAMETFIEFADSDADCSFRLGVMYDFAYGVKKDDEKACYWYSISANLGEPVAQYNLGNNYQYGRGVNKDQKRAFELYMQSALQGYANAMYKLAKCYDDGIGTDKNEQQALIWYKKAIASGRKRDYFSIAYLLAEGSEAVKDEKEAIKYYLLSIEEGNAAACNNMGVMYAKGRGVEKDEIKAIEYYEMGSNRGNASAKYALGCRYEEGKYVSRDLEKALQYFEESAAKGYEDAKRKIPKIRARIDEEQKASVNNKEPMLMDNESPNNLAEQSEDKEHAMLNAFVKALNSGTKKRNLEVNLERNLVIWTADTNMLQSARIYISFKPETTYKIQYAFIRLYNMVDFSEDKREQMYKICNDANNQYNGLDFYVDERDNSITANMRAGFTKELCGAMCMAEIVNLANAVDKVYPMFMKALWS